MVGTCLNSFASHTCRDADFQPDLIPVVMALPPRCTNSDQNNSSGTLLLFEGAGRSDNFHLDDTLFWSSIAINNPVLKGKWSIHILHRVPSSISFNASQTRSYAIRLFLHRACITNTKQAIWKQVVWFQLKKWSLKYSNQKPSQVPKADYTILSLYLYALGWIMQQAWHDRPAGDGRFNLPPLWMVHFFETMWPDTETIYPRTIMMSLCECIKISDMVHMLAMHLDTSIPLDWLIFVATSWPTNLHALRWNWGNCQFDARRFRNYPDESRCM